MYAQARGGTILMTLQEVIYMRTKPTSYLNLWEDQQYYETMFRGTEEAN